MVVVMQQQLLLLLVAVQVQEEVGTGCLQLVAHRQRRRRRQQQRLGCQGCGMDAAAPPVQQQQQQLLLHQLQGVQAVLSQPQLLHPGWPCSSHLQLPGFLLGVHRHSHCCRHHCHVSTTTHSCARHQHYWACLEA